MSLVELSLKDFLPVQVSWWQLTWGYWGIFVNQMFAVILGLSWLFARMTLCKVNSVLSLSRSQGITRALLQKWGDGAGQIMAFRLFRSWVPRSQFAPEITDSSQETLPYTFCSALGSGESTVAGIWHMNIQVLYELRSCRKNLNSAAAGENYEALILWTLDLRYGSGGCFSPLQTYLGMQSLELIPTLHREPCLWSTLFPFLTMSLTSISFWVSCNSWY